jgi:uncharacterized membrane protein YdbT with pleckstrin-like domain
MKSKFPSAIDTWLVAVLVGAPLLVIAGGVVTLSKSTSAGLVQIGIGVAIALLMALFALPCYYIIGESSLKIRCGVIEEEVPFHRIMSAERSSSLWSAPALSLRRVKIMLDDGFRLVSPRDRDEFIETLKLKVRKEN